MARFSDVVGYDGGKVETAPGVWEATIVEHIHYGDVQRIARKLQEGISVNDNLVVQNAISIVADEYASENFHAIKYVRWMGVLWTVTTVEVQHPRLVLRLGEKYNGPTAN